MVKINRRHKEMNFEDEREIHPTRHFKLCRQSKVYPRTGHEDPERE